MAGKKGKQLGLRLDMENFRVLEALAICEGTSPTSLANKVVKEYLAQCHLSASDVDEILKVKADYDSGVEEIRARIRSNSSSSEE